MTDLPTIRFGKQVCGSLDEAATREWLVTDGLGGFAMGTVSGLRTRRYHGLLVVATEPPIGRRLALASLDPVLVLGDQRVRLATHEWADGTIAPTGHRLLDEWALDGGVPRWRWSVGPIALEAELAMAHGRPAVGVRYRLVSTGTQGQVRLEVEALTTWRDVHGERTAAAAPATSTTADGFAFEGAYRVRGPGFEPIGEWYRGVHHREEAARGLTADEDVWCAGRFTAELSVGAAVEIEAWAGDLDAPPPAASALIGDARHRATSLAARAGATDATDGLLAHAADQLIVTGASGPTVVAGYPWFGSWSRDTMTSYEGLFLGTGRHDEGRVLLLASAAALDEGMLANTADAGTTDYNAVDGALWFLHAVGRHVERTGDDDLGVELLDAIGAVVDHYVAGTRFGIKVEDDGLVTQGADRVALTWMDARVDGVPVTQRRGKPVEVNALWLRGLRVATAIATQAKRDASPFDRLAARGTKSFRARFVRPDGFGLFDVVDGDAGDDASVRPNQLLAASLPGAPVELIEPVRRAVESLVTPLGLRALSPDDTRYLGRHRGNPAARDAAYHQGTVWPWLVGPYADVLRRAGRDPSLALEPLADHLAEWGIGSVSETADGDAPHGATGCPFQAWSVAELLRARALGSA